MDTFDKLEDEQKKIPLAERKRRLQRFETVMLCQQQIEMVEELFLRPSTTSVAKISRNYSIIC